MEGTCLTPNTVPPKSNAWATWSLLLGIIGIPLCLLVIPELLAIIFGIVALVKISKSAGVLAGKGKALIGIILGGISIILVPIILVISVMLYLSLQRVEHMETIEYERMFEKDPELIKEINNVARAIEEPIIIEESEDFIETEDESEEIE